jgi:hypothetical protein
MTAMSSYTPFAAQRRRQDEGALELANSAIQGEVAKRVAKYGGQIAATPQGSNSNISDFADSLTRLAGGIFTGRGSSDLGAFNAYATGGASSSEPLVPGVGTIYRTGAFG